MIAPLVFASPDSPEKQKIKTSLDSIKKAYVKLESLESRFEQVLVMDGVDEPETITGHMIYSKPNLFKIDYKAPKEYRQWILIDGSNIYFYVEATNEVLKKPIPKEEKKDTNRLIKNLFPWFEHLEHYQISLIAQKGDKTGLKIIPKRDIDRESFTQLIIYFNPKSGFISETAMSDENGNTTTFRFLDLAYNHKLSAKLFKFKRPKKAKISVSD